MEAIVTKSAVPSILIVTPSGITNLEILESIFTFSSTHLNVTGNAAELKPKMKFYKISCNRLHDFTYEL